MDKWFAWKALNHVSITINCGPTANEGIVIITKSKSAQIVVETAGFEEMTRYYIYL